MIIAVLDPRVIPRRLGCHKGHKAKADHLKQVAFPQFVQDYKHRHAELRSISTDYNLKVMENSFSSLAHKDYKAS